MNSPPGVESVIVQDPDVMGGMPVFRGTRVPIVNVLASLRAGFDVEQMREAYDFLTPELLAAALRYEHHVPPPLRESEARFEPVV